MTKFEESLEVGRLWEQRIARWLMLKGWLILPVYDYSGNDHKAPKLEALKKEDSLVLPDLLMFQQQRVQWMEVKYKESAVEYRKTHQMVTGLNLRLWNHYKKVQEETGHPVFIAFIHQREEEVVGNKLSVLGAGNYQVYEGDKMGNGGMIFFPYSELKRWCNISVLQPGDQLKPPPIMPQDAEFRLAERP